MVEGELQCRADIVVRLQDECEKLGKMLTVVCQTSRSNMSAAPPGAFTAVSLAPDSDRVDRGH